MDSTPGWATTAASGRQAGPRVGPSDPHDQASLAEHIDALRHGLLAMSRRPGGHGDIGPSHPATADGGLSYEATDATATVRVILAADGLPSSIHLSDSWRTSFGSDGLAAAVTEACANAVATRPRNETDQVRADQLVAADDRNLADLEAILTHLDDYGEFPRAATTVGSANVTAGSPDVSHRALADPPLTRPVRELLDELLGSSAAKIAMDGDGWDESLEAEHTPHHRLSLAVTFAGTVTCSADPEWVSRRQTPELNEALAAALVSARAEHTRFLASQIGEPPDFSTVFESLIAAFTEPNS